MKRRRIFISILALGFALRLVNLSSRGINYDDAFSIFLSARSLSEIISGTAVDTMPPLYYFLLHFWMKISWNLGWLRILSIFLSMGGIVVLYLIAKELFDEKAALWAMAAASISPFQIYHAQDLRMYTVLQICQLGYIFFFIKLLHANKKAINKAFWSGLVICGTLSMYTHNLAVFFIIVPTLYLLIKRNWGLLIRLVAFQALIGLLSLPWLVMVPGQLDKIQKAFWTPVPGVKEIIQSLIVFNFNLPLQQNLLGLALIISLLIVAVLALEIIFDKNNRKKFGFPLFIILVLPTLLFVISYFIRPVFVQRGFIVSGMFYYIILSAVISREKRKAANYLLAGLYFVAFIIGYPYMISFSDFPRSEFKQAVEYLESEVEPETLILHDNKLSGMPSLYYSDNLNQKFLPDEPGSHNDTYAFGSQEAMQIFPLRNLHEGIDGVEHFYFIVFAKTLNEYQEMGEDQHPQIEAILQEFDLDNKINFGDLEIWKFSRN